MATTEMYTYCHTLSLRVALPIVGGPSPVHGRRCPEADEGASAASRSCSPESLRHALAGSIASQACITLRPGIAIRATTPESGNDRQTLRPRLRAQPRADPRRSEEHTSELQSLMRISYAVFCLQKKTNNY